MFSDRARPAWKKTARTGVRNGRPSRWRRTCRTGASGSRTVGRRPRRRGQSSRSSRSVAANGTVARGVARLRPSRASRRPCRASNCGRTVPGLRHYCCCSDRLRRDGGGLPLPRREQRGGTTRRTRSTAAAAVVDRKQKQTRASQKGLRRRGANNGGR